MIHTADGSALRNATPEALASDTMAALRVFLSDNPVIEDDDTARSAAGLALRAKKTLDDIEDERKGKTRPLHDRLAEIQAEYKAASVPLGAALETLRARMTAWAKGEEERRQEEADRARAEYEAKAATAEAKIAAAEDAADSAAQGEIGVDVVTTQQEAVRAVNEAKKADRVLQRAERDTVVRMAPGMGGRAFSLRTKEELILTDVGAALAAMGLTEKVRLAILSDARAYRKLRGELPPGVIAKTDRSV